MTEPADVVDPTSQTTTTTSVAAAPDTVSARRVLIAEDETLVRLDLGEMLAELGYNVVGQAADGEQAVALANELKPDVAILDVKMPKLDGISAATQIVSARICPVVMLTAFSQLDLVERARAAGAMAYLVKPFTKADLVPAIEIAVSRQAEVTALEGEVADLTERLETRKVVERAKSALQAKYGLDEPSAFRWIQKTAMDMRVPMRRVAELVIDESIDNAKAASSAAASTDTADSAGSADSTRTADRADS